MNDCQTVRLHGGIQHLIHWGDCHEGSGAWIAAISTFSAVLVALAVPLWQEHLRQKGIKDRTRLFLIWIGPGFTQFKVKIREVENYAAKMQRTFGGHPHWFRDNKPVEHQHSIHLRLPEELQKSSDLPAEIDKTVMTSLINLRSAVGLYHKEVNSFVIGFPAFDHDDRLLDRITTISRLADLLETHSRPFSSGSIASYIDKIKARYKKRKAGG